MGILDVLMRRKTQDVSIVWGIRTTRKTALRWKLLAAVMRVPTNRLVLYVLQDWMARNAEVLQNEEARNRLADKITDSYVRGHLN